MEFDYSYKIKNLFFKIKDKKTKGGKYIWKMMKSLKM